MSYVLRRVRLMVLLVLGVAAVVFVVARLIPGDIVEIVVGVHGATAEERAALRSAYGLDRPVYVQFGTWLARLLRGDLGRSLTSGHPVASEIAQRLLITLELAGVTLLASMLIGVTLGTALAMWRNSLLDAIARILTTLGLSVPYFLLGILLILVVSLYLPGVFVVGYIYPGQSLAGNLLSILLPTLSLVVPVGAVLTRMTRGAVLDEISQDYLRTAAAKGVPIHRAVFRHVLPNALIPVVTQAGFQAGFLLGSAVVIEEVFSIPGLGRLVVHAVVQRDYPLLQGAVLVLAVTYVVLNFVTDLLYAYLDPRIRYEATR